MSIHPMKRSGSTEPFSSTERFGSTMWLGVVAAFAMVATGMLGVPTGAQAAPEVTTVCSDGCDYTSIQAAVNAVKSSPGATIEVAAGTYKEDVAASNVTLVGAGAEVTKIVATSANTRPLTLGSNATVRGFTLT